MENKKISDYSTLAAICFGIVAVYYTYWGIRNLFYVFEYYEFEDLCLRLLQLIKDFSFGAMAVTVFIKNKKAMAVSLIVQAASNFAIAMEQISYGGNPLYNMATFLLISAFAVMFILDSNENKNINIDIKKIWFVPGVIYFILNVYTWIAYGSLSHFSRTWTYILMDIVLPCGIILAGLWLKEDVSTEDKENVNAVFANAYQANAGMPNIGDADRLMKLKDLLDSGIITQEEFDEKKKEILKLT